MQFNGVGIIAINKADSLVVHLTLRMRIVFIDFVINLPINMISWYLHVGRPILNNFGKKVIEERINCLISGVNKPTTGMPLCT